MEEEIQHPPGCIIAETTVIPELTRMRIHVDEVAREHRQHDDRLNRLHLQADDADRRLTRLEGMVEAQTRDTHELARRFDALDSKVCTLVDGSAYVRDRVDTLLKAFTDHGILINEQHNKRMRGQMGLWVLLGGSLVVLSALHHQATGSTPLQAVVQWIGAVVQ